MPVDPNISLQVAPPPGGGSPFDMISKFAETQQRLNDLKLFRQTFAARQRAGEILAASSDPQTAVKSLMADPLTASFAPELAQNWAGIGQALVATEGARQGQFGDAYKTFLGNLPSVLARPESWPAVTANVLAGVPGPLQPKMAQAMENIRRSLTDGLPPGSAARPEMNRRAVAIMSPYVSGETLAQVQGQFHEFDLGNQKLLAPVAPVQGGPLGQAPGTLEAPGSTVQMGLPPSIQDIPNAATGATERGVLSAPGSISPGGNPLGGGGGGGGGNPASAGSSGFTPLGSTPGIVKAGELGSSVDLTKGYNTSSSHLVDTMPVKMQALDSIFDAMKHFRTGGLQPERQAMATTAQGLMRLVGASEADTDAIVDKINGGSLPAAQFFNTQLKPLLVRALATDATGTGRVMLPEVEAYLHLLDTSKDPRAIAGALNNIKRTLRRNYDMALQWNQWRDSGKDAQGFAANWSQRRLQDMPKMVGDFSLEDYDARQIQGGNPGGGKPPANRPSLEDILNRARRGAR